MSRVTASSAASDFERQLDGLLVPGFPQLLDQPVGGMVGQVRDRRGGLERHRRCRDPGAAEHADAAGKHRPVGVDRRAGLPERSVVGGLHHRRRDPGRVVELGLDPGRVQLTGIEQLDGNRVERLAGAQRPPRRATAAPATARR